MEQALNDTGFTMIVMFIFLSVFAILMIIVDMRRVNQENTAIRLAPEALIECVYNDGVEAIELAKSASRAYAIQDKSALLNAAWEAGNKAIYTINKLNRADVIIPEFEEFKELIIKNILNVKF